MYIMENMRFLRKHMGISQRNLAKILGVTHVCIHKIENGMTEDPAVSIIARAALFFGVSLDDFVEKELSESAQQEDK